MNRNRVITHVRQETRRARSLLDPVPGHFLRPSDNAAPRLAETSRETRLKTDVVPRSWFRSRVSP